MSADVTPERIARLRKAYGEGCRTEAIGEELFAAIDTLHAEVQRLTADLAARDAAGDAVPPDVVILRDAEGYNTIWWTSTPNHPRSAEHLERHLRNYPGAIREDLWRHPTRPAPAQAVDVVTVPRRLLSDVEDALSYAAGLGPCGLGLLCQVQDALRAAPPANEGMG